MVQDLLNSSVFIHDTEYVYLTVSSTNIKKNRASYFVLWFRSSSPLYLANIFFANFTKTASPIDHFFVYPSNLIEYPQICGAHAIHMGGCSIKSINHLAGRDPARIGGARGAKAPADTAQRTFQTAFSYRISVREIVLVDYQ
jgi:hypothetical protein